MLARRSRVGRRRSIVLPLNLSDTASTSQDVSSLKFMATIAGSQCYIQDASVRGLWAVRPEIQVLSDFEYSYF